MIAAQCLAWKHIVYVSLLCWQVQLIINMFDNPDAQMQHAPTVGTQEHTEHTQVGRYLFNLKPQHQYACPPYCSVYNS